MAYFIFIVFLNCAAVAAASPFRRKLHPLEIMTYWGCFTTLEQQESAIVIINLQLIKIAEGWQEFWSIHLNSLILNPILTLLLLDAYLSKSIPLYMKTSLTVVWLGVMVSFSILHRKAGVLMDIKWNYLYTLLVYAGILSACLGFAFLFRMLLRREEILT